VAAPSLSSSLQGFRVNNRSMLRRGAGTNVDFATCRFVQTTIAIVALAAAAPMNMSQGYRRRSIADGWRSIVGGFMSSSRKPVPNYSRDQKMPRLAGSKPRRGETTRVVGLRSARLPNVTYRTSHNEKRTGVATNRNGDRAGELSGRAARSRHIFPRRPRCCPRTGAVSLRALAGRGGGAGRERVK
jgi:hypothetical protein